MRRSQKFLPTFIFLIIISLILGVIHYFLYFSFTRFIDFEWWENLYLATSLGILSMSFIVSSICAHYWDNRKTRYAYYLSSVWMGALFYLTLAFASVWLIVFFADAMWIYFPLAPLGVMSSFIAWVTVIYGISNARNIQITRVDVQIRNLPPSWEGKKIAHISDVHVGHILRSPFVRKIVKKVNKEAVEMLCITWDLFDGMDGRLEHLVHPLGEITAPHGVIYVDGNHETYLGIERAFASLHETKTRILRDEIVSIDGLDIIGIDYPEPWVNKDIAETIVNLPAFQKENPSILLYHTPYQIDTIARTWVDLELCWHTHRGQMWPWRYLTQLIFQGRDYGLTRIWDYSLYTSSGVGTWGPPVRVGTRSEIVILTLHRA